MKGHAWDLNPTRLINLSSLSHALKRSTITITVNLSVHFFLLDYVSSEVDEVVLTEVSIRDDLPAKNETILVSRHVSYAY